MSDTPKRKFSVRLDGDLIRQIKRESVDTDRTIENLVSEILSEHFSRKDQKPRRRAAGATA